MSTSRISTAEQTKTNPTQTMEGHITAWNEKLIKDVTNNSHIQEIYNQLTPLQKECLKVLVTGAMSFGSISYEAHTTIAAGVNALAFLLYNVNSIEALKKVIDREGPISNSGEGGELPSRNNTILQSGKRQIASGRFGADLSYVADASEIEIKIAQGAKPGVGGELPGLKVTVMIAAARHTEPGITLVSPPPHHDIYSIEDLKQLIHNLRVINPEAKISVKLAACHGIGVIAAGVAKCGADGINVAGPGGTGAAPVSAKYEFVLPWEGALAEINQVLTQEGLRDHITLTVSGGIQTGLDCFKAILIGGKGKTRVEMGTAMLVAVGCIMAEYCHNGKCPTGVATQKQENIDRDFAGKPENVVRWLAEIAASLAFYLERYGFKHPIEAAGRTDLLRIKENSPLAGLEKLLVQPNNPFADLPLPSNKIEPEPVELEIIEKIKNGETEINIATPIPNTHLTFGGTLAAYSVKHPFPKMITIKAHGIGGQGFGFCAPRDLKIIFDGNVNGSVGNSLSGAHLVIKGHIGNASGNGAIEGEIDALEMGNRGGVRLSGAKIITLRTGQMAFEYMTGGIGAVLGTPKDYINKEINIITLPPSFLERPVIGPHFGASFTGGKIYLPKKQYHYLQKMNYLASDAKKITPLPLDEKEARAFQADVLEYANNMEIPWLLKLACMDVNLFGEEFIKLQPSNPLSKNKIISFDSKNESCPQSNAIEKASPIKISPRVLQPYKNFPFSNTQIKTSKEKVDVIYNQTQHKDACGTGALIRRDGTSTREITLGVLAMLKQMMHRGAKGRDQETGDGCGVAWYGLHDFFKEQFSLPLQKNHFAVLPIHYGEDENEQAAIMQILQQFLQDEGLSIAAKRDVQTARNMLGVFGRKHEKVIRQYLVLKPETFNVDAFEKALMAMRLRFELSMQLAEKKQTYQVRPHLFSASPYYVIYKSMIKEDRFANYFIDFTLDSFKTSAGVPHSRFATNTLPVMKNIQPLPELANNGENNASNLIPRFFSSYPEIRQWLQLEQIDLSGFSDSHLMSLYITVLRLTGYSIEEVIASTTQPYDPNEKTSSTYNNLFAPLSFEGPNASIYINEKIAASVDINAFRPADCLINEEVVYIGSEYTLPLKGEAFALRPGIPLMNDITQIPITPYEYQVDENLLAFQKQQFAQLKKLDTPILLKDLAMVPLIDDEELSARRLRAGWTSELYTEILQSLFTEGKVKLQSMADQGPVEKLAGKYKEFGNFFKGKFSEVTNPSLAKREELDYMSTQVFVGAKPHFTSFLSSTVHGFYLESPVVDNDELNNLIHHFIHQHQVISFTFNFEFENLSEALERIQQKCVEAVLNGVQLLILSDVDQDDLQVPIHGNFAKVIDKALRMAGIRHQVTLVLSLAGLLTGRDATQAISLASVDVINPYLAFIPDAEQKQDLEKFTNECANYKKAITHEILSFQARMGISTVLGYKGLSGFVGIGLSQEVADLLEVPNEFGNLSMLDIEQMFISNYFGRTANLGKYQRQGSKARHKIWDPVHITPLAIKVATESNHEIRKENYKELARKIDALERVTPRDMLYLAEPHNWNKLNPMPVCIIGGGAAGFFQADKLFESGLPVRITIIEKNPINKFGLVGDGIAPDHPDIKNQAKILQEILKDDRVSYYGGIEIGKDVSYEELQKLYPCIIDCRGAAKDITLNVPGETEAIGVIPASRIYTAYNSDFFSEDHWPLATSGMSNTITIVGSGNVAADLARILLKEVDTLADTKINPLFLKKLAKEGPSIINIIARSKPQDSKMGIIELNELKDLPGVQLCAHFIADSDLSNISKQQKEHLDFFLAINNRKDITPGMKQIHFYFEMNALKFEPLGNDIKAFFVNHGAYKGSTENFADQHKPTTRAFTCNKVIVAIGRTPLSLPIEKVYASGWAVGKGGTLSVAKKSAEETAQQILNDFKKNLFLPTAYSIRKRSKPTHWQLKCSIDKIAFLNIIHYLEAGHRINTQADFHEAKHFSQMHRSMSAPVLNAPMPSIVKNTIPKDPDGDILVIKKDGERVKIPRSTTGNLLEVLKAANAAPDHRCDGQGICGQCVLEVNGDPVRPIKQSKEEVALLSVQKRRKGENILSCFHFLRSQAKANQLACAGDTIDIEDLAGKNQGEDLTGAVFKFAK